MAISNEKILVATGPIITEGYKTIGTNNVAVPSYFFKVIADSSEPDIKGSASLSQTKNVRQYWKLSLFQLIT